MEVFPANRYNLVEVSIAIIENFMYGLATEKGFALIEDYKNIAKTDMHNKQGHMRRWCFILSGLLLLQSFQLDAQQRYKLSAQEAVALALKM